MFYCYTIQGDDNVLFLRSMQVCVINGLDYYTEAWYESPEHATQFHKPDDAIRHVCYYHTDMADVIMVMPAEEATGYL